MTIEVTGCHDCPFAVCDYEGGLEYWCEHFKRDVFKVEYEHQNEILHKSCPLKQDSITVKLNDNEQTGVHKERV